MKGEKANLNICFISCIKPNSYKTRNQKACNWLSKGHQLHIKIIIKMYLIENKEVTFLV